jgi:hypothetical protein
VLGDYPTLLDMHDTFKGAGSLIGHMLKLGESEDKSDEAFLAAVLASKVGEKLAKGLPDELVAGGIQEMLDREK